LFTTNPTLSTTTTKAASTTATTTTTTTTAVTASTATITSHNFANYGFLCVKRYNTMHPTKFSENILNTEF
jgi:hypothetical protein